MNLIYSLFLIFLHHNSDRNVFAFKFIEPLDKHVKKVIEMGHQFNVKSSQESF